MAVDKPQTTADEIMASIGSAIGQFEIFHNQILVGIYMRPEKTAGGVILPDKVKDEDRWQGKVGLVLKKGASAFVNDARNDFHGLDVTVGQWVVFRVSDALAIDINGVHCRMLEDIHIKGVVESPSIIW
jgi:co-chaperonin GroES (HSP10)